MDGSKVHDLIRAELARVLGPDKRFGDHDLLADHGLDSMRSVELTLNLEDVFAIVFEDEELAFGNFASVSAITELVSAKVGTQDGVKERLP
ncbi:acyl carrier protein [Nocardia sp. NPDC052566]|uniref:acyl carrier protein n=1 Tax=Nocardia sp. NPDC052566 TaxID=3364330 RepID=UPI0037CA1594